MGFAWGQGSVCCCVRRLGISCEVGFYVVEQVRPRSRVEVLNDCILPISLHHWRSTHGVDLFLSGNRTVGAAVLEFVYASRIQKGETAVKQPPRNTWDWLVGIGLIAVGLGNGTTLVWLLVVIVAGLYFLSRPHLYKKLHHASARTVPGQSESDDDGFLVASDDDSNQHIDIDVDIAYRPCKNHFRFYSRFDIYVGEREYEYKIEGTEVFIRLLQDKSRDPGEPEYWEVRDGVVQEMAIRQRKERQDPIVSGLGDSAEETIKSLKEQTQWSSLSSTAWNGFKYYLLSRSLPSADARRYFRQELERLGHGAKVFTEAAAKLGYAPKETKHRAGRPLQLMEGREHASDEQRKQLPDLLPTLGITLAEFDLSQNLLAQLRQLLGDPEPQTEKKHSPAGNLVKTA